MGGRTPEPEAPLPPPVGPSPLSAAALGLVLFVALIANGRPIGSGDTRPTERVAASLVQEGNLDLDEYPDVEEPFARQIGPHRVSIYPDRSAVLAARSSWPRAPASRSTRRAWPWPGSGRPRSSPPPPPPSSSSPSAAAARIGKRCGPRSCSRSAPASGPRARRSGSIPRPCCACAPRSSAWSRAEEDDRLGGPRRPAPRARGRGAPRRRRAGGGARDRRRRALAAADPAPRGLGGAGGGPRARVPLGLLRLALAPGPGTRASPRPGERGTSACSSRRARACSSSRRSR